MNPFEEGYYAGLIDDRKCPHLFGTWGWIIWQLGNDIGVRLHCATVEAVYMSEQES